MREDIIARRLDSSEMVGGIRTGGGDLNERGTEGKRRKVSECESVCEVWLWRCLGGGGVGFGDGLLG